MIRVGIVGGGISGLTAAYALELARLRGADLDWHLYEASNRLGGTVETTRLGEYILEGGPDGWITDKPWARDLAVELGLKDELIVSNDATRKTYILRNEELQPVPDGMRMMVPTDLTALQGSALLSDGARVAYAAELTHAEELKAAAPAGDESVSSFVLRHFGEEVLTTLAAPLLSGVFGGDVNKLSVRSVMPQFVAMEREHGSLIAGLQASAKARGGRSPQPIFTSLRRGMASLTEALIAKLPPERLHLNNPAFSLKREGKLWCLRYHTPAERGIPGKAKKHFKHLVLATSADVTRTLIETRDNAAAALLPTDSSSAVLAAFTWPADVASTFTVPQGFGFLVPQTKAELHHETAEPHLLAATFVDQKFPHRAPAGARILRAFFGTGSAEHFAQTTDAEVARISLAQLGKILGPLPQPEHTTVRRWPRSLPQYEVGHLDRMTELKQRLSQQPNLHLIGNAYNGVGLPDLIRDARATARAIVEA
jgi:oxygen-dependent protoporphyrinogen oxidase